MDSRPYGVDALFCFPLVTAGGTDLLTSFTPAVGDVKLWTNNQVAANPGAEMVAFTSGSEEPTSGDAIDGATSAASGTFMFAVVTSGTWAGGDAAGFLFLKSVSGTFQSENLDINGGTSNVMTIGGDTTAGLAGFSTVAGSYLLFMALTASEMSCSVGSIQFVDSATKAAEDTGLLFGTHSGTGALAEAVHANMKQVSDDANAADNLELACDNYSATRGLAGTALPAAAADAAGGLPVSDAGGLDLDAMNTSAVRLTAARAGYIDNLNVGGNVASSAEVTAIQNNTRVVRVVPEQIVVPESGTLTYVVELFLYDAEGNMEAPDSAPTIELLDQAATDLSARLSSTTMTLVETGRYRVTYTSSSTDDLDEHLRWTFSVIEGGATRKYGNGSITVDQIASTFTATDRSTLNNLAGEDGSSYNAIPWNPSWDAEVQSEVADALSAYDPPTKAEMDAAFALLNNLTAGQTGDAVLDEVIEGSTTLRQFCRLIAAAQYGKLAGAATSTVSIRNEADSKDRIVATVDADGNRTAVVLDKT